MESPLSIVTRRKVYAIPHCVSEEYSDSVVEELKNVGLYKGAGAFETEEVSPCNWCMENFNIKKNYKMRATHFAFYRRNGGKVLTHIKGEPVNVSIQRMVREHPPTDCQLVQRKLYNVFLYGNDIMLDKEILLKRRLLPFYVSRIINRYIKYGVGQVHFNSIMKNPTMATNVHVFDEHLTAGEIERFANYYYQQRKAFYKNDSKKCDTNVVRFNVAFSLLNDCARMRMVADYNCDILSAEFPAHPSRGLVKGVSCYHGAIRLYNCIGIMYALSKYFEIEMNVHLKDSNVCDCLDRPSLPRLPANGSILEMSPDVTLDSVFFQVVS